MKRIILTALMLAASLTASANNVLSRIEKGETIKIGVRGSSAPFSFIENGQPAGYVVELCQRAVSGIAAKAGRRTPKIAYVEVTTKNRLDLVASGAIDLECGSTTVTQSRLEQVEFSNITFVTGLKFLLQPNSVRNLAELTRYLHGNAKVAVVEGTTAVKALQYWFGDDNRVQVVKVADYKAGAKMVATGDVYAMLGDEVLMKSAAMSIQNGADLELSSFRLSVEPYAIAINKDEQGLRLALNKELDELYRTGEAERLLTVWLTKTKLSINTLTAELMRHPGRTVATPAL